MVVVDTSIALKWFFPEEGSAEARRLLKEEPLAAPDLLLYEFSNVLVGQRCLSGGDIRCFLGALYELPVQFFVLPQKGFQRAAVLARQFSLTVYDASFLALAEGLKADMITADLKLIRKVGPLPFVRSLGEV